MTQGRTSGRCPAASTLRWMLFLATLIGIDGLTASHAQASGSDNAVGVARALSPEGVISSAGSYSAYTGSTARTVPDLVVPGGVGAYPLVFLRTSTSRYVPGDDGDGGSFGGSGSWRHNYRWGMYRDNPGQSPAVWRVHYPDGRVIKFSTVAVAAPNPGGAVPAADPYLRSTSPGLSDRLEQASGNADLLLHRHDGSVVYFQNQGGTSYRVSSIYDPYNQITNFSYYLSTDAYPNTSKLKSITEPAGRSLTFGYVSFNGGVVLHTVASSNGRSGQSVQYDYAIISGTTGQSASSGYTALTLVTYNSEQVGSTACQAVYTYQGDNTGAGLRPLLLVCNDPHFPGPMPRIRYSFVQGSSQPYGQIQAEIDAATGTTVSSYNQSSLTESTGDGANSYFAFGAYLITHQQDADGGQSAFGYDGNDYLNSVTNKNGHNVTISHEPYVGKRTAISRPDPAGGTLTTTFNYGSNAFSPYWVMSVTDPRGQSNPNGHTTTFTRDGNHQVSRIDYPDGTYDLMSYNGLGQVYSHRLANGNVLTYYFDGRGMLTQSTDSANGTSRYTKYYYDGLDRLTEVTDFNGHNTFFTYNGRHQLTQIKHDDNTHLDYTYDTYGNQVTSSDELGHVTTLAYDSHRRPTSVKVPVNQASNNFRTATFTYERGSDTTGNGHTHRGFGTMTLVPSGKKVKRTYTGKGRLVSTTKGYGQSDATTDSYTYDKLGDLKTVTDANNIVQATYTYDALDRKSTLTDANGHVTTWSYYPAGNQYAAWLQSVTAPGPAMGANVTTNYNSYDVMGRWLNTTDQSGQYSGRGFDSNGRLSVVGDINGSYIYGYDADSRVNSIQYPDNTTQTWTYDPVGNVISYKNRGSGTTSSTNGETKTISYDDRNRPIGAYWSNNMAPSLGWVYDAASRLTDVNNDNVALHCTYDDSGLPLSEQDTNYFANGAVNTTSYGYDQDGNVTTMTYPTGEKPGYTYDDQNRCEGLNGFSLLVFQGERVAERLLGNNLTTEYYYQPNNRVSELWHHHGGPDYGLSGFPANNVSLRYYGYAPDGQLTWSEHQPDSGDSGSAMEDGRGENYGYANNGALTGFGLLCANTAQNTNSQQDSTANPSNLQGANGAGGPGSYSASYAYDASGNRSQVRQLGGASFGYGADGENRYGGSAYSGSGCTTDSAVGWTYFYNAEGQMVQATRQSDGYNMQFAYDGVGRLIYQGRNEGLTIFCYAGSQRIEERNLSNNASIYRYFFDAPGSDRITFRQSTSTGARLYYQYDAAGNTTHVSDDNGNVLEQYLYDAYGQPDVYDKAGNYLGQTSPHDNRYLFHGASAYEWIDAPGLYYCRARMYLPTHGRWLQPDPIGFAGGDLNLYRYCGNDPVNGADPSGLFDESSFDESSLPEETEGLDGDDGGTADSEDPRDADGILGTGDTPTGSHIPSVTYTKSNSDGVIVITNTPWLGQTVDWQSSPSVTAVGGLSMVASPSTGAYMGKTVVVAGTGQTYKSSANVAKYQGADVVYSDRGSFGDLVMDVYSKLFGGYNNEDAIDLAAYVSPYNGNVAIYGYSEGAATMAEAASDYNLKASSMTYYAPAVSIWGAQNATAQAGAIFGGYVQHWFDISNVYAPSANPLKFLSGLVPVYNISVHTGSYPPFAPSPSGP